MKTAVFLQVCEKSYFGQLAKMMRHIKSVHTRDCNYMCDVCAKPFADKDNYTKHAKTCKVRVREETVPRVTTESYGHNTRFGNVHSQCLKVNKMVLFFVAQGRAFVPKASNAQSHSIVIPTVLGEAREADGAAWSCAECDQHFREEHAYREHMAAFHWGCTTCSWQFLDEKPFKVREAD